MHTQENKSHSKMSRSAKKIAGVKNYVAGIEHYLETHDELKESQSRLLNHKANENPSAFNARAIERFLSIKRSYEDIEYLCMEMSKHIDVLERNNHNQKILMSSFQLS